MSRRTRDGTVEPVLRDLIIGRDRGRQGNIHFPCSADHVQDWQPYPVGPYNNYYMRDHTLLAFTFFHYLYLVYDKEQLLVQQGYFFCNIPVLSYGSPYVRAIVCADYTTNTCEAFRIMRSWGGGRQNVSINNERLFACFFSTLFVS